MKSAGFLGANRKFGSQAQTENLIHNLWVFEFICTTPTCPSSSLDFDSSGTKGEVPTLPRCQSRILEFYTYTFTQIVTPYGNSEVILLAFIASNPIKPGTAGRSGTATLNYILNHTLRQFKALVNNPSRVGLTRRISVAPKTIWKLIWMPI
jgi:hypothetical protein